MSNSNGRNKEYATVHHLVSRIAHRVYFLAAAISRKRRIIFDIGGVTCNNPVTGPKGQNLGNR